MNRNRSIRFLVFLFVLIFLGGAYLLSNSEVKENLRDKITLPYRIIRLTAKDPDTSLALPIKGISVSDVEDTFGAPRPGWRKHEGIDIFADKGTPIYSVSAGYVIRVGESGLGGKHVSIIGAGGRRYYYAHLDDFSEGLRVGQEVNSHTVIGYVGNTGNATGTPAHLHFGMYGRRAINPYPLFVTRGD